MITLKEYAKKMGIHYMTARNWWHQNKIEGACLSPSGRFYVNELIQKDDILVSDKTCVFKDTPSYVFFRK